jgi:hypothetical protein
MAGLREGAEDQLDMALTLISDEVDPAERARLRIALAQAAALLLIADALENRSSSR